MGGTTIDENHWSARGGTCQVLERDTLQLTHTGLV